MDSSYIISAVTIFIFINIAFIFAQLINDNSKIDIGWGMGFLISSLNVLLISNDFGLLKIILFVMIFIWGIRLSIYILLRGLGKPEDFRYAEMRKNWGKRQKWNAYYRVFILQASIMYVILLPVNYFYDNPVNSFSFFNIFGLFLFIAGFSIETIADQQMKNFKRNPINKGRIIQSGLWKYSRHPNYFGEAVLWWGIFFYTFQIESWWTVVSPILINFLLIKISGIPMLEKKYENHPDWEEYKKRTPAFFPFFNWGTK